MGQQTEEADPFRDAQKAIPRILTNKPFPGTAPPTPPYQGRSQSTRATIEETIRNEAIPRLLLSRKNLNTDQTPSFSNSILPDRELILEFLDLVRTSDMDVLLGFIGRLQLNGMCIESVWLDMLAPVARILGEMWENDECDFLEVTVCTWRLHLILRSTSLPDQSVEAMRAPNRRILVASLPGEQHSLGLALVEACLRRAGWHVWSWPGASYRDLIGLVRSEWFSIVGISSSDTERMDEMARTVRGVRKSSLNKTLGVLVGGPAFTQTPELATRVGAHAAASDGRHAVQQAHNLLTLLS